MNANSGLVRCMRTANSRSIDAMNVNSRVMNANDRTSADDTMVTFIHHTAAAD